MPLTLLKQSAIDRIWVGLNDAGALEAYRLGQFGFGPQHTQASRLDVGRTPVLDGSSARPNLAERETANAIAVYTWLEQLTPAQAADGQLWTSLCHMEFPVYCKSRWTISPSSVRSHWFVEGIGLAGLRRNAIARLWWAAYLTLQPSRDSELAFLRQDEPWTFLKVMFSNQDVYQGLMERSFGSDYTVRICVLEVLRVVQQDGGVISSELVTKLLKEANLQSSFRELGVLTPEELLALLRSAIR